MYNYVHVCRADLILFYFLTICKCSSLWYKMACIVSVVVVLGLYHVTLRCVSLLVLHDK